MITDTSEKVDISRILIHPVNGSATSARVTSIEAANSVLERWTHETPEAPANEYEVEIIFEDGLRYSGHYQFDTRKKVSLGRNVRRRLSDMASPSTKRVARESEAANDSIVGTSGSPVERAKTLLEHYNI
ncbi:hypothetical protein E4K72_21065 [Oxalobacteraceae bacterium OM1]|nr:hypothetical protein E4K72_21065 [Oxalobacteraceae bacterium OM1]